MRDQKQFKKYLSGSGATGPWLDASLVDDVCATGSAAEAWLSMRDEEDRLALEERARLLYVAMTRAREVCLLAMDAPVGRGKGSALTLKPELDLTPAVLERILPDAGASLTCDRLGSSASCPTPAPPSRAIASCSTTHKRAISS